MDRIIAPGTVAAGSADVAPATGTPGYATDGNPATNTPATLFPAYAFNAVQEELIALILGGGLAPDRAKNNQVLSAIRALMQAGEPLYTTDTGTANAIVAAFTPAPAALTDGMVVRIKIANRNTGATILTINGFQRSVIGLAGQPLSGDELAPGGLATFVYSLALTQFVLLSCSGGALQIAGPTHSLHATNLSFADARYATLAGLNTQKFKVAPAVAADDAVNKAQLDALAGTAATEAQAGLIKLATTALAQALTDDATALTSKKLDDAFRGANQLLAGVGYQRFPGGLLIQQGAVQILAGGYTRNVVFPIAFPNTDYRVLTAQIINPGSIPVATAAATLYAGSADIVANLSSPDGDRAVAYLAIGRWKS